MTRKSSNSSSAANRAFHPGAEAIDTIRRATRQSLIGAKRWLTPTWHHRAITAHERALRRPGAGGDAQSPSEFDRAGVVIGLPPLHEADDPLAVVADRVRIRGREGEGPTRGR